MSVKEKELYEFGEFRLDVAERFLARSARGERVPLSDKAFATLCVLVRNAGHLVEKNELLNQVWADTFVEENNLNKCVHAVRRALGENGGEQQFIETVQKHGYRFIAEVRRVHIAEVEKRRKGEKENQISLSNDSLSTNQPISSSPLLAIPPSQTPRGADVALADWRREANGNKPTAEVLLDSPKESTEQIARPAPVSTKPNSESRRAAKYRLPLATAAAVLLIGAAALGYYFFSAGKIISNVDGKKSIAVLPLKPINTANRDEIYEIGIADSLIHKLSSMKGFVVRPLSATRQYADIAQDPIAAGREQRVDYVLASNYQLAGGKIRVTAQLFNVANGQMEEPYKSEKDSTDFFAMQDAIAGEIGNNLSARFAAASNSPTVKRGTTNEEAYRFYLQGITLNYNRTPAAARKAVEYFEQAVRLDPNFALAFSGMAHAYLASGSLGGGLPREEYEKARAAVNKALELDGNLGDAHAVLGELKFTNEWDFAGAEKDLLRAVKLEPNSDLAREQYAFYLAVRGRFDEAAAESNRALEISPASLLLQHKRGVILYLARRYDEAITQQKRVFEVDANHATVLGWLWLSYEMKGDDAAAYEWFMKFQKQKNPERLKLFQNAYNTADWQGVRQKNFELQKSDEQKPSANLYAMARHCALLGEKEQAFAYLNKAFEKHQGQMIMLNVEPSFDNLRDDPRFDELVRRVGLK